MKLLSIYVSRALLAIAAFAVCALHANDVSPEATIRPLRLQLYYISESNSSYMQTMDNYDEKRPPRVMEPITLWYSNGKSFDHVQVRPGQRSSLITVFVAKDAVFYRADPSQMETIPADITLRIPVAPGIQQGLLMMRNDNLAASYMIDTSQSRIPDGAIRVINQSRTPIAAKVGSNPVPIKPDGSVVLRAKPESEENPSIKIMLASMNKQGDWAIFYSTLVSADLTKRMLVLIYADPEKPEALKVRVMSIPG